MVAELSGGVFGAITSADAGTGGGVGDRGGAGGVAAGVVAGSVLGEHAASSAMPRNGTYSMKWRRLVKLGIVGTFGKFS